MLDIQQEFNIPTKIKTLTTSTNAANATVIGQTMPAEIGYIYGISVLKDGIDEQGQAVIAEAQLENVFLQLKRGTSLVFDSYRLDQLCFSSDTDLSNPKRYLDIVMPGDLDLSTSQYITPNGAAVGNIVLNLFYLSWTDINYLNNQGISFPPEFLNRG